MPLDAIAIRSQICELKETEGYKIDKIQQPERDMLVLTLRGAGNTKKLLISASSANARVHFTHDKFENPSQPPMFCMLLRKHLTAGKIKSISQKGFERIVDIEVESRTELGDVTSKHIICEIMGRNSNIVFLNEELKIIDSIKHVDITVSSVRNILPGLKYMLPPTLDRLDPENAAEEDFLNALNSVEDQGLFADKAITGKIQGISPLLARECVFRALGDGNLKMGEIDSDGIKKVARELYLLFDGVKKGDFHPCILIKPDKTAADFAPVFIGQYGTAAEIRPALTMNEAVEEFYLRRDRDARMKNHSAALMKTVSNNLTRARKKLALLQENLKEAMQRDKYRVYGDLLTANLYRINKGDKSITVENYYLEGMPKVTIPLDEAKAPSQNVKSYYNKYKKAKNAEIYSREQTEKTTREITYLESVEMSLENASSLSEIGEIRAELEREGYIKSENKRKAKSVSFSSQPMEFSVCGYRVLVGRNNVQNDYLTFKIGRSRDMWLHAKNIPGSHTLIKYQDEAFPDEVIEKAASLAAYFSKGKNAPKTEVDYCPVSHVKKSAGAKPGMVIYEGYSTALVKPANMDEYEK